MATQFSSKSSQSAQTAPKQHKQHKQHKQQAASMIPPGAHPFQQKSLKYLPFQRQAFVPHPFPPQMMHMLPQAMANHQMMGFPQSFMQPMQQMMPPMQSFPPMSVMSMQGSPQQAQPPHQDTLRPFAYACKRSFEYLDTRIAASIKHLRDKEFVTVRGLDYKDNIEFTSSDGRPQKWALHTTMYGKMKSEDFKDRENTHDAYYIISPFVALQHIYREKGFIITNESDPLKGHTLVVVIRRTPLPNPIQLWHGQNVIADTTPTVRAVIDNFYRTNFQTAARFVNSMHISQ